MAMPDAAPVVDRSVGSGPESVQRQAVPNDHPTRSLRCWCRPRTFFQQFPQRNRRCFGWYKFINAFTGGCDSREGLSSPGHPVVVLHRESACYRSSNLVPSGQERGVPGPHNCVRRYVG
ncbi:hypothetical protein I553_4793 [Mycobacterium xenopi 4042]|uniref:Uncharacterized protein n=1 Tax=Mycobacterium xenopi 4042 TaxID=1299334 RepID=X8AH97_MYCXE|nr:hypothetical protein I553_4793 [Mycobacterium xenopi 4042]